MFFSSIKLHVDIIKIQNGIISGIFQKYHTICFRIPFVRLMKDILHQLIPIIYRVFYMPGGCLGFLNHQQYHTICFRIESYPYLHVCPGKSRCQSLCKAGGECGHRYHCGWRGQGGCRGGLLLGYWFFSRYVCLCIYFTGMNEWSKTCILYNEFVDVYIYIYIGRVPHKHMQFTDMITQDFGRGWVGFFENVTKRGPQGGFNPKLPGREKIWRSWLKAHSYPKSI